jgi:hypothetical protein
MWNLVNLFVFGLFKEMYVLEYPDDLAISAVDCPEIDQILVWFLTTYFKQSKRAYA